MMTTWYKGVQDVIYPLYHYATFTSLNHGYKAGWIHALYHPNIPLQIGTHQTRQIFHNFLITVAIFSIYQISLEANLMYLTWKNLKRVGRFIMPKAVKKKLQNVIKQSKTMLIYNLLSSFCGACVNRSLNLFFLDDRSGTQFELC